MHFEQSIFIYERNQKITDGYQLLEELGEGAFGRVRKVKDKKTMQLYAVKMIRKGCCTSPEDFQKEIDILKSLDHPNIIKIYEYY